MLITKLKLNYFGKFYNKEIVLKPGINLIYGENEAGKTTIHTFIRGMFFGIERLRGRGAATKEDTYTRYLPWGYPGAYSGSMDVQIGEKNYRMQRNFHVNDKSFAILDLSSGREVKLKEGFIHELIPGLTESTYKNTISISQLKAQTDAGLATQVRNFITNLSIAKSREVNVTKAVSILTEQRKKLETSRNISSLKELQAEIEEGQKIEEKMDQLTIQLQELLLQEQDLLERKQVLADTFCQEDMIRLEQLPAVLEKYRRYEELSEQLDTLEYQSRELALKNSSYEQELHSTQALKKDKMEVEQLKTKDTQLEKDHLELQMEQERGSRAIKKDLGVCILPAIFVAILIITISSFRPEGIIISLFLLGAGAAAYRIRNKKRNASRHIYSVKFEDLNQQIADIQKRINQILEINSCSHMEELAVKFEEKQKKLYLLEHTKEQWSGLANRKDQIEDSRDKVYEDIMKYIQYYISAEELTSDTMKYLQEEVTRRKQQILDHQKEINRQYESCRLNIEKLRWEISALEDNEEKLLANQDSYKQLELQHKKNTVELEAVKMALTTIQELSADIHDGFGNQLNQAVSEVISEITQNKYTDLKIDEKLEVKVGWNGEYLPLDRLSAGTIDQVYFALRLAIADLLLDQEEVPLLFDDSLALYDETRVKSLLPRLAQRKQVLLFTCHRRERKLFEELAIPYHYIDLSDRP